MKSRWLRWIAISLCALSMGAMPAAAQESPKYGDELYQPRVAQAGKDVVWVPTPDAVVLRMLEAAKVTSKDLVYDLGAGDGKIAITAAKRFGARAVGIEYNPDMAALARRNAQRAGVANKVEIIQGDIFEQDFSKASVVTLYLLPELNLRLRPTLLKMKPGTRIVSHQFHMEEWEPDQVLGSDNSRGYLWIVPADVEGRWTLRDPKNDWQATVNLTQRFQRLEGAITVNGVTTPLLEPNLRGANIGFAFVAGDGGKQTLQGTIQGESLSGSLRSANQATAITGRRR